MYIYNLYIYNFSEFSICYISELQFALSILQAEENGMNYKILFYLEAGCPV